MSKTHNVHNKHTHFFLGIKEEHDGFFSCEIHSQNDQVLAEKSVEVSVIRKYRIILFSLHNKEILKQL